MIKRVTYAGMAVIMSAVLLFSGNGSSFAYASAQDVSYEFDHARTAVAQLEDLFTTIDIMDATVASLSDEMEKGNVTSEQLVQMYIAYFFLRKLASNGMLPKMQKRLGSPAFAEGSSVLSTALKAANAQQAPRLAWSFT